MPPAKTVRDTEGGVKRQPHHKSFPPMTQRERRAMALTAEQIIERKTRIGGSDAGKIVSGLWHELWLEKTGRAEPEDLTWVLPVQLGILTEPLNIAFYEHATGHRVFGQGEVYLHPDHPFIGCTLDGLTLIEDKPAIIQCKHVSAFAKIEEVEQRYYAQCAHEMLCTGASSAYLSVFMGTLKHEIVLIGRDRDYTNRLLELEREFWSFVERDEPPPRGADLVMPVKPETYRTIDFTGSNEWTASAVDWIETNSAAKRNDKAAKALRAMVEPDVGLAIGAGVEVKRAKDGKALYLREIRQ